MSSKKKFFYGFFSDIGISGIKIFKILLLIPFVISYTSSELYGLYLSLVSIIGLLGLVDLGSGMYIIKELAKVGTGNFPEMMKQIKSEDTPPSCSIYFAI